MSKLSIITINFNNEKGLLKTIQSVENQTWQDFEFIIIDGGSTDGSKQRINECKRVNYSISEKDKGVYNAMNKGIKAAHGEYIIFMNSGDIFYSNDVLEEVNDTLNLDYQVVFGNTVYYNDANYRREEIPPDELSFSYFLNFGINHQSSFIKRTLFFENFLYNEDYKICSDWEFFLYTICNKNASYKHIDTFICYYDFSGISADPKNLQLYHEEKKMTIKKYFPLFYNDYLIIDELNSKRMQQILSIKKNKFAWRIMKWIVDLFLIFTGNKKK